MLNLVQLHEKVAEIAGDLSIKLSNDLASQVIKWSGGHENWIKPLLILLAENPKVSLYDSYKFMHTKQGLFQPLFEKIPDNEKIWLTNPILADHQCTLVKISIIKQGKIASPLFHKFLASKNLLPKIYCENLTKYEVRLLSKLSRNINNICDRDSVAEAIWGKYWYDKYSDWAIDNLIYRLRKKICKPYTLDSVRNSGYVLNLNSNSYSKPWEDIQQIIHPETLDIKDYNGISPHIDYLTYMNDPKNARITYVDLLTNFDKELKIEEYLCTQHQKSTKHLKQIQDEKPVKIKALGINSFSVENMDHLNIWLSKHGYDAECHFSHYHDAAMALHLYHLTRRHYPKTICLSDDIRDTKLIEKSYDLLINDLRLNFNTNHQQNINALKGMYRLLNNKGVCLVSTMVDYKYESDKYGNNQDKAPLNTHKPGSFIGDEGLQRKCYPVPYYLKLFNDTGFKNIVEFDQYNGMNWRFTVNDPQLVYRRWMLIK